MHLCIYNIPEVAALAVTLDTGVWEIPIEIEADWVPKIRWMRLHHN